MPDPLFLNIESGAAARSDLADPARRGIQFTQRVRALRGDFTDSQPLALIPSEIDLSTNPTTTDTITLGGEVYEFVTAAGAVAADVNIAVAIGGTAAATLLNLLAAINGGAAALHANITNIATTAPALGRGTKPVFADDLGSSLMGLWYTGTQGLAPANMTHADYANVPVTNPSFAVSDALTAVVAFTILNFNLMPVANPTRQINGMVGMRIPVTTAMLDVPFRIRFAGAVALLGCVAHPKSATGVPVYWDAATIHVTGNELIVDFDTGASVDPANGEFFDVIVFGQFAGIPT